MKTHSIGPAVSNSRKDDEWKLAKTITAAFAVVIIGLTLFLNLVLSTPMSEIWNAITHW